ncbi:hypothetical protein COCC4DRAFT_30059 [Bipolaris maydis ATCC 48331]|uniref:Uncharacterized protein n=2 Tax=Cochliobolus heterostrophus TaxID=5016 RepID=M2URU6_COCH5|nr:uncharacterized protein COCC4DRAFT_30059 [Bipolaris maydis ATCC 48331]EMD90622.1 hypothetical protein COCHEDRAFT_1022448 [Bipolaris maydis C5]ENI09167.1 hypothetical protein COCC4DRAFT_30059 [Bipolaris maydis ATCC 48331]
MVKLLILSAKQKAQAMGYTGKASDKQGLPCFGVFCIGPMEQCPSGLKKEGKFWGQDGSCTSSLCTVERERQEFTLFCT